MEKKYLGKRLHPHPHAPQTKLLPYAYAIDVESPIVIFGG